MTSRGERRQVFWLSDRYGRLDLPLSEALHEMAGVILDGERSVSPVMENLKQYVGSLSMYGREDSSVKILRPDEHGEGALYNAAVASEYQRTAVPLCGYELTNRDFVALVQYTMINTAVYEEGPDVRLEGGEDPRLLMIDMMKANMIGRNKFKDELLSSRE